ncbi:hypothetical protein MBLNU13_g00526t2 [Cladosporium sp. NU13]
MSDNIPFYAQEIPCNMDSEHDLGQRTDPDLPDFNIPDDFDWSDSMDAFDWSANDVPDALGSCNAGPISTVFNNCPIATCTFGPCTLEVLGVHIHHAHEFLEEGRAVLNATTCKTRKCPLWRCGKHLVANQLMAHIQTHDSNDLEAAKSTLEMEGFLIEGTTQNGIAVRVICPVCRTITADAVQFMRHLSTDHLQTSTSTSGGYVHFEQWKAYWRQNIPKDSAAELKNLLPWSRIDYFLAFTRILKYRCPCCSFSVADVGGRFWAQANQYQKEKHALIQEHHLSFLRPEAEVVAELYPYRMAILRLCPEFVTHPVFADFNQLSQQSTAMITET